MSALESQLGGAIAGDRLALRAVIAAFTPVIQARAARSLVRRGRAQGRDARQELADLAQDVLLLLFRDDARVLRAREPERGLSLLNYVGREELAAQPVGPRSHRGVGPRARRQPRRGARGRRPLARSLRPPRRPPRRRAPRESDGALPASGGRRPRRSGCLRHHRALSTDAVYTWQSRLPKRARQLLIELSQSPSPLPGNVA